ncbi:hypothetical protein Sfum_3521 [Syntrophobacter fumaroxidans MPOB]|uniref:Uncharacterized protein n=1 Tax=Syntrophobacter fumaroxidans (strain DSM 10017 / MPOB) TaxID=335543 RepID=A0LP39_SYNFM|nr:hypothetical protein Sfum_3521 [Syntrophobacter fumaroxidans MPOB]
MGVLPDGHVEPFSSTENADGNPPTGYSVAMRLWKARRGPPTSRSIGRGRFPATLRAGHSRVSRPLPSESRRLADRDPVP